MAIYTLKTDIKSKDTLMTIDAKGAYEVRKLIIASKPLHKELSKGGVVVLKMHPKLPHIIESVEGVLSFSKMYNDYVWRDSTGYKMIDPHTGKIIGRF